MRDGLRALTSRGRSFLASGIAALLMAFLLGENDLFRIGVLVAALPLLAALVVARTRYRLSCARRLDPARAEVVVIPPFTDLRSVQTCVDGDKLTIGYGAQDVSPHESGAYTGDISAGMLAKLGCSYVLAGHSERREIHGEDDAAVNAKAKATLAAGMTPLVCVGEGLEGCSPGDQGMCGATACTRDLAPYCSCNNTEFQASGTCPNRQFAHRGPCEVE